MTSPSSAPAGSECTPTTGAQAMGADAAVQVSSLLKALADPLRLRMLSFITTSPTGEACVCDIATVADVSQPTVSHHLKVLKDVGVLSSERRGTWVWYSVVPHVRRAVITLLEQFAPAAIDAARERTRPLTGLSDIDASLTRVADDLARHSPELDHDAVLRTVRESYATLLRTAGVSAHLVPLARRFAEQRLTDLARASAPAARGRAPQVLFVCVANAGRSQLAAALLHHYAGDAVVARSAGSAPAGAVHTTVRPLLADLGVDDEAAFPKPLTDDAVRAADVVITMGCGDTCPVLPGTRYEDWVVGDPALASPEGVAAIRDDLDRRVRALLADLVPDLPLPLLRPTDHQEHR
ncbi:metalloregulator ArsR/SmtB family transcription factor [uncultured Cellulomonas sp.]|uniref:metalloregulator ArsR/SmtB family transcription factor n=1 Tax=uncultured Cellulomonas sp. TaxID=189682 RepID=UPI002637D923|nr:metalloregulator ArsR/SmtB family transcription factor [uncultured Cellulomonas sp.]